MLSRLEGRVFNTADYKPSSLPTIHKSPHIPNESVNNSECMSCSRPSLVLSEAVEPLQHCLDVLLVEKLLHKLDCAALSKSKALTSTDSLDRFCLSSSVTRANVDITSTRILTTISSIAGVGGIRV